MHHKYSLEELRLLWKAVNTQMQEIRRTEQHFTTGSYTKSVGPWMDLIHKIHDEVLVIENNQACEQAHEAAFT
jgi:hypothetical protein